ncbi:hypothetical protein ACTMTI_36995 [Nonomuraea sp. H19]|uniref:hypothetical protein n=1 Tax=Nonomuraea sp. H19 TaxID=3452206 RepID=UPI003F8CC535
MTVVGRVVAAGIVAVGSLLLGGSSQAAAATSLMATGPVATRPIVTGAGVTGAGVAGADSAGQITSPSDGQVVSSPSVTIAARTGLMQLRVGLYVEGPATPAQKVAEGGANQTISGAFDAGNAPNGAFTVTLKGELTGTRYAGSTFKLRRPAEAPGNVNASLQGTKKVVVTWSKGSEPDLQSYEISNSRSGIVGRLPADSACAGSSCEAVLAVPDKAAGEKVGFTVKAFRSDGDGGSIGSDDSGAAYVTVPAPPAAQPKKETAKTRVTPKATKKVDSLPTLPTKKQTQPTRKPTTRKPTTSKLPAIPDTDPNGNLPIPTAEARVEPSLTPADSKNGADPAPVQAGGVKPRSSESPLGNISQYGFYVTGGLLLLLLGAHAGGWARRRALAADRARQLDVGRRFDGERRFDGAGRSDGETRPDGGRHPLPTVTANAGAHGDRLPADAARGDEDGVPSTAPPRRRPAVILAVAKTRVPQDQSDARKPPAAADPPHAPERPQPAVPGQARKEVPAGVPLGGSETRAVRKAEEAGDRAEIDAKEMGGARQEPVRIALPSSAVTEVSEPSASVPRAAIRIEDRWDDYLPPSPRSMEDSGFWERPQPGAGDFWAADEDDDDDDRKRAFAGRQNQDGLN